ncbi:acyl carrier protein [Streptomyces sp. NPDC001833]|uniref:acyl carrier protein n=1 Tax=Streptomyces sp. NPDC001833 TaxID=3154658 RepID=UPI00332D6CDE
MDAVELEDRVSDLVAAVLGMERAEIDEDFQGGLADLGYTSLQAVQLNRLLEEEFGCEINVLDVVDAQGIRQICAVISKSTAERTGANPKGR